MIFNMEFINRVDDNNRTDTVGAVQSKMYSSVQPEIAYL